MITLNLPYDDLTTTTIDGSRYYKLPNGGHYPSVTTMLGSTGNKQFLVDWRERIGDVEADILTTNAASRGEIIHKLCEKYLYKDDISFDNIFHAYINIFKSMTPLLDRINPVGLEVPLYSDKFQLAGRMDCLGYYDGVLSIIDFKTSGREKSENWITDYFLQATCYSYMLEDLLGITAKQIVIIVGVHNEQPQVFIKDRSEFRNRLKLRIMKFRRSLVVVD